MLDIQVTRWKLQHHVATVHKAALLPPRNTVTPNYSKSNLHSINFSSDMNIKQSFWFLFNETKRKNWLGSQNLLMITIFSLKIFISV